MVDTVVSLGGYTFSGWGVPELINGGGSQRLAIHRLLGGARVIDVLGWDPAQIRFSGRLRGANATTGARLLETLARIGVPVVFTYWSSRYQVIVSSFTWQFERYYEVTYKITLEVLADLTQDLWQTITQSLDDVFNSDLTLLTQAISTTVALPISLTAISSAQAQVGLLQDAAPAVLAPLTTAVAETNAQLQSTLSSLDASLPAGDVGGIGATGDPATLKSSLTAQTAGYQQLAASIQGAALTSRMQHNLEDSAQ